MKIERIPPMTKRKLSINQDERQHWRKNSGRTGAKGLSNKIKHEHEQIRRKNKGTS